MSEPKSAMKIILSTLIFFSAFLGLSIRESSATTSIEDIPSYPGSQILCSEHESGQTMHILWRSFSTSDPIPAVVAYFELKLKVKAATGEHESRSLISSANTDLKVTIYPASNAKSFPGCGRVPEKSAQTVILISQALRSQTK